MLVKATLINYKNMLWISTHKWDRATLSSMQALSFSKDAGPKSQNFIDVSFSSVEALAEMFIQWLQFAKKLNIIWNLYYYY